MVFCLHCGDSQRMEATVAKLEETAATPYFTRVDQHKRIFVDTDIPFEGLRELLGIHVLVAEVLRESEIRQYRRPNDDDTVAV